MKADLISVNELAKHFGVHPQTIGNSSRKATPRIAPHFSDDRMDRTPTEAQRFSDYFKVCRMNLETGLH